MESWFDGVFLFNRHQEFGTGCWLLVHNREAALLELPPYVSSADSPVVAAKQAVAELGVRVKYLLCTHPHGDHFCNKTLTEMREAFPQATAILQNGFRSHVRHPEGIQWFDDEMSLELSGEPLFLVHAPKHNATDTLIVFRGAICTGDWELNTLRTVNEQVPVEERRQSIQKMIDFARKHNYHIHRSFSVHANDRRHDVDFTHLMEQTLVDRKLW
jgi:glyoxylase-like metal-dependent hydrolase (beta-lactamase superfamily II)